MSSAEDKEKMVSPEKESVVSPEKGKANSPEKEKVDSPEKEKIDSPEKEKEPPFDNTPIEVATVELPAPPGWTKKFTSKLTPRKGGTGSARRKNEVVFTSPTGEQIRTKWQLQKYLKSHPDGPTFSEFSWGTVDTPRRSARISEKVKSSGTPEGEPSNKKKKLNLEGAEDRGDRENEDEEAAAGGESKATADSDTKEADGGDKVDKQVATEECLKNESADSDMKEADGGDKVDKQVATEECLKNETADSDMKEADVGDKVDKQVTTEECLKNETTDSDMKEADGGDKVDKQVATKECLKNETADSDMKEADGGDKVDKQLATEECLNNESTVEQANPVEVGSDAKETEVKNQSPTALPSQTEIMEMKVDERTAENKVGEEFPANGSHNDNQDGSKATEAHATVNCDDGHIPSKTSSVNC